MLVFNGEIYNYPDWWTTADGIARATRSRETAHRVRRACLTTRLRIGRGGRVLEQLLNSTTVLRGSLGSKYAARLSRALSQPDPFSADMQLCSYSTPRERAEALDCTEAEVNNDIVLAQHRAVFEAQPTEASFLRKILAVDQSVYLPGLGLAYVDRAGMEFGVEVRVPWLDLDLVEWSRSLPDGAIGEYFARARQVLDAHLAR